MKKKLLFFCFLMVWFIPSFGQNNPVQNLNWSQWYEYPRNFFELSWDEPAQPHNELLGYNIYRDSELYRFQTERTVYNYWTPLYGIVTNCGGESFFSPNDGGDFEGGFEMHVTAVYAGSIESPYIQTAFTEGMLLATKPFTQKKASLFPNPTNGVLYVGHDHVEKIVVYDISGKAITEFVAVTQIDLSNLSKGVYIVKLLCDKEIFVDKIVIR